MQAAPVRRERVTDEYQHRYSYSNHLSLAGQGTDLHLSSRDSALCAMLTKRRNADALGLGEGASESEATQRKHLEWKKEGKGRLHKPPAS